MPSNDIIIIGAGMFGSSAAKHIRKLDPEVRIALIGPADNESSLARGQHFDEARICRRVETMVPWCYLNDAGLLSYRETERESGIDFYTPCGCVWVASESDKANVCACLSETIALKGGPNAVAFDVRDHTGTTANTGTTASTGTTPSAKGSTIDIDASAEAAEKRFGGRIRLAHLEQSDGAIAGAGKTYYCVEAGTAGGGTVHPSRYVQAQLAIAASVSPRSACTRIEDVVTGLEAPHGDMKLYTVRTASGKVYRAPKVLVATAHFALYHGLVPRAVASRMAPLLRYAILLRVVPPHDDATSHDDNVAASVHLPSIIRTAAAVDDQFYCLPPRYYASKQGWYVKIAKVGPPTPAVARADVTTLSGALAWYDDGKEVDVDSIKPLADILSGIYISWPLASKVAPATDTIGREHLFVNRCIIDTTDTKTLFIDRVDDNGWYCCVGGNGKGAKTCDAIGRVAAYRVLEKETPTSMSHYKDLYRL